MEFADWEPIYEAILADFGFDRAADEVARDLLVRKTTPFDDAKLSAVAGATVAVAGAGPSLETATELEAAREADLVFAASTAADVLADAGIGVACMVTDLDKNPETVVGLTREGVPVAVHAHGDNVPALRSVVPRCREAWVLPTTQAEPAGHVRNVGGFTDGDRAAFLADSLGAGRLTFVGWDLDDPTLGTQKERKLEWAVRLLTWLERRRGERYDVLDGRRATLDGPPFPTE